MYDYDLRPWSRLAALVVSVLLLLALYAEVASAQAQALPYSADDVVLSTANPSVSVRLDILTFPDRPLLKIYAIPDQAHRNMTLEVSVSQCPLFAFIQAVTCTDGEFNPIPNWTSDSEPGPVEFDAPVWQCTPAPRDPNFTGDGIPPNAPLECLLTVTAENFGSGGSPATFDLHVVGETRPLTNTAEFTVNTSSGVPPTEVSIRPDRVPFMTDAAEFRWIYNDDENDNTVETFDPVTQQQLGACTSDFQGGSSNFFQFPYEYDFVGSPSYVGFDCCTWRADSESGTTGSGQVLLKVNLAPSAVPPDTDGDGFFDPCDNCKNVPNGPFLGTCVTPAGVTNGLFCFSNDDCSGAQFCSMAQEDNNFSPDKGLVCLPEPGATALLASGVLCLMGLERRRRRA